MKSETRARCEVCGADDSRAEIYHNPPSPKTAKRHLVDLIQFLGWHLLPLGMINDQRLIRPFRGGLFKYRHIQVCNVCGLGAVTPMPSAAALARYYRYAYRDDANEQTQTERIRLFAESLAYYLARHIDLQQIASIFEFGAGFGDLSRAMKRRAPHLFVTAAELGEVRRARIEAGDGIDRLLHCHDGTPDAYDLLMSSHSFEHVNDATGVLRSWASWVKPGGYIFLNVPHCIADFYRFPYASFPHTYFFTTESLRRLAEKVGLEVIDVSVGGRPWNLPGTADTPYGTAPWPSPEDWDKVGPRGDDCRAILRKPA